MPQDRKEQKTDLMQPAYSLERIGGFVANSQIINLRGIDENTILIIDKRDALQVRNIKDGSIVSSCNIHNIGCKIFCIENLAIFAATGMGGSSRIIIFELPSLEKKGELVGSFELEDAVQTSPSQFMCRELNPRNHRVVTIDVSDPSQPKRVAAYASIYPERDLNCFALVTFEEKETKLPSSFIVMALDESLIELIRLSDSTHKTFKEKISEDKVIVSLAPMRNGKIVAICGNKKDLFADASEIQPAELKFIDLVNDVETALPNSFPGDCNAIPAFDGDGFALTSTIKPDCIQYWHLDLQDFIKLVFDKPVNQCFFHENQLITLTESQVNIYNVKLAPEFEALLYENLAPPLSKDTAGVVISYMFSKPHQKPDCSSGSGHKAEHKKNLGKT